MKETGGQKSRWTGPFNGCKKSELRRLKMCPTSCLKLLNISKFNSSCFFITKKGFWTLKPFSGYTCSQKSSGTISHCHPFWTLVITRNIFHTILHYSLTCSLFWTLVITRNTFHTILHNTANSLSLYIFLVIVLSL